MGHSSSSHSPRSPRSSFPPPPPTQSLIPSPSLPSPPATHRDAKNEFLLSSELRDLISFNFNDPSVEYSFRLSQACVSVAGARPISLALAAANLLYSYTEVLRLEPYSNAFLFVVCVRAVGGTLLVLLVYLLLHCVSNELSEPINAGRGPFDLSNAVGHSLENNVQAQPNEERWNQYSPFDHSRSMENGAFHGTQSRNDTSRRRSSGTLRQFAALVFPMLKSSRSYDDNNQWCAESSSDTESQCLVDNPSATSQSASTLSERPPKTNAPPSCCSIYFPPLITSKNYSLFIVSSTLVLSLIGSFKVYFYPESGSQYLICLALIFYWTVHHASFTLPWKFAASASLVVSIPVATAVMHLPIDSQLELEKGACFLAVVYVALVYANYRREMQSRQMFWLTEKAKADKSAVEKSAAVKSENESKSAFIANVSHEMRTPLSAVICAASLLMDGNLPADEVCHLAKIVHATSETLSVLINDLLDLASCEANRLTLHPAPISLADLANDTVACLAPGFALKRLDLACHVDTRLWYRKVICDRSRLSQILVNLLNNGMKFTSTGGVALNMDVVSYDNWDEPQNVTVLISIEDSGMGIPPEAISQLGGRFYQVESGAKISAGTGLGLSISRALIEKMGSQWTVSSIFGQGTKFEFSLTLPLAPPATGPESQSSTASELKDVLKTFSAEDEPSRWHCLVIGGSALARCSFLKHLEDLKVATAEDATPDRCKEDIPEIAIYAPTSEPRPSSSVSVAPPDSSVDHRSSSGEESTYYRDLRSRIRNFVRGVQKVDPYGIPVLFADECFIPQNLGLVPLKKMHGPNGFAILDRTFDLGEFAKDDENAATSPLQADGGGGKEEEEEEEQEQDKLVHLFPIQVRHQLYNDRGDSFSRSSSRGMSRPLFAESATSMEYEEHVRDLETHRRLSYCSTDTIGSPKRGSFSTDPYVSPLFWAPLNKPVTARGIAMTMKTAFAARGMWRKPAMPSLSPLPSPESESDKPGYGICSRELSVGPSREEGSRSRRTSGEPAGETLCISTRKSSPGSRPELQTSPSSRHRRHSISGLATAVPDSAVPIRVLVAEDNPVIISVVTRILAIAGFKVEVAMDGEKASKMYENSIDFDSQRSAYGAIMMDVRMERMDGVTCAKRIRRLEESQRLRHTPILATTGQDMNRDQGISPFDDVLPKPYDRARLVNTLRNWTEGDRLKAIARG